MVAVDSSVRLISLQFSFSNPNAIPQVVKQLDQETSDEREERKSRSTGVMVIEPNEKCSLVKFLEELEIAGYEIVDAFCKERIKPNDPRGTVTYHMVRFLFARREFTELSEGLEKVRETIRTELREMCRVAMWRVRAFSNPFYMNGEEVAEYRTLSINLESRVPFFLPDGQPVVVWPKDEGGERIGDVPLPIVPDYHLRIIDDTIRLMAS